MNEQSFYEEPLGNLLELKATISEQANTITKLKTANREIAEWNAELNDKLMTANVLNYDHEDYIEHLKKQRNCLKEEIGKLANQPHLNRLEVEKIIRKGLKATVNRGHYISDKSLDNKITAILNLAYDKDRIVGILDDMVYVFETKNESGDRFTAEDIANEIIGEVGK